MNHRSNTLLDRLGIDLPIIQAPMAGVSTPQLAIEVANTGGLGSLACAMLTVDEIKEAWESMRKATSKPLNLNFFSHKQNPESIEEQERWKNKLAPYYKELGLDINQVKASTIRTPFDNKFCDLVEDLKPEVISFHFGLPEKELLQRVKNTGAIIMSSATTLDEAKWLEANGCNVIIAQGVEAGGHRGMFLTRDISTQIPSMELLQQIVQTVSVPVVAAGGIADSAGIKAALDHGASAVQLGTVYLFCPEVKVSSVYRKALLATTSSDTVITNVFSGRPARSIINRFIKEVGPISSEAPEFPYASHYVSPLRTESEKNNSIDFMALWAGQSVYKSHSLGAANLTRELAKFDMH